MITYGSRTYNKAEVNYCTTRKELLAVVYFVKQCKQYLLGRKFLVRTDHAALTWLQRTLEMIGQQARWQERLQEFSFTIQHRPATKHGNADALSRRPCRRACCCLPAEEIDDPETAPPSLSRADALTVDGDETTVSTEPTADDANQGRHQNRPTGSGSPLTTETEPWPPLEAKWMERLFHQEGQLSGEMERIARFQ